MNGEAMARVGPQRQKKNNNAFVSDYFVFIIQCVLLMYVGFSVKK
jgi:hypothetical protein